MSIEIRRNEDDTIDEIVAYGPDGNCWFHLEQEDKDQWYFTLYGGGDPIEHELFGIYRSKKKVHVVDRNDETTFPPKERRR